MSITWRLYTFPLTRFHKLITDKENNSEEIIKLLFRNTIKDKELLKFVSSKLKPLIKKKFLNADELERIISFTYPLREYYKKINNYNSWLKSKDRKFLLKNRHRLKRLYIKAPKEIVEEAQSAIDATIKLNPKYWIAKVARIMGFKVHFPTAYAYLPDFIKINVNGRDKKVKQFGYTLPNEEGKIKDFILFLTQKDYKLSNKLQELKKKEKEWQKLRKWYANRKKWLRKCGLGGRNFMLALKLGKAFGGSNGTLFNPYFFENYEFQFFELEKHLKEFEDPITKQFEDLQFARYKYPIKSKERIELEKKNEELIKRFSFNPFNLESHPTLVVFDLSKIDKVVVDKLSKMFSDKTIAILKNMVKYGEDGLIYDGG